MDRSEQLFATARPWRLFFTVAMPGLISMLAMSLYQAIEGAFVGQYLGESAFAAINIAMPVVMINFALADLVGVGSSAPISVALGRKDEGRANNIFTCSVIMIFLAGLCMGILMYFMAPLFVRLMGAEGELARQAVRYVRVYAVLSPVTTIVFAMDNYLRISGFVKGSMFLNIFMSLLTGVQLVIYLGVLEVQSVSYSALASCISMLTCAVIAVIPFVAKKAILRFVKPQFSVRMVKDVVVFGAPTFLNNIAGRVAAILMNAALLRMGGETAVAAYSVLMYAGAVIEPMLYGMCDSVQPAVGYNWGARSLERVRDITKASFTVCALVSILCTVVMLAFPGPLASIFVNGEKDVQLMKMSVDAMRIFGLSFIVGWFSFAVQGFFAAIEKPLFATIISICKSMVFPVVLIYALEPWGLNGLWFNYAGTSLLAMMLAVILLLRAQKEMKKRI